MPAHPADPYRLDGKTVLVTGASGGIGRACALHLAHQGAQVILTGRNAQRLHATLEALPPHPNGHTLHAADLTDTAQRDALADALPPLDGLVHNAGIAKAVLAAFITPQKLAEFYPINYEAPVLLNTRLLRQKKIKRGAAFVFISSAASHFPGKGGALYSGTKAALEAYSKVLAAEYAHLGIRSNCVLPGLVHTDIYDQLSQVNDEKILASLTKRYPLGFGQPDDVAHAVGFLLSPAARWLTGQNIYLDGGLTISPIQGLGY